MSLRPWGVILAGGDGTRLKSLSRSLSGDNRPKQFCTLFGNKSLLARTRGRLAPAISADRMLFAVARGHERFYRSELADVDESRIVIQPFNRGTTAAIVYSLLRLKRFEKDAVVALFPSDHHFADETQFARTVDRAFQVVRRNPSVLVLLGAMAEKAEVEYGWIEPGQPLEAGENQALTAFRVERFWEKPSQPVAEMLLRRGCLWNTLVVAGQAETFLEIVESTIPDMLYALRPMGYCPMGDQEARRAAALYGTLPSSDFSRDVLTRCAGRLAVLRMENSGWGDLGTPERALAAIHNAESAASKPASAAFGAWLTDYRRRLDALCEHKPEESVI